MAVVATIACALLCGCGQGNGIETSGLNERADGRFAYENLHVGAGYAWRFGYVVDTETGVTYLVFDNNRPKNSIGGITPLLNRDGTPVIDDRYE
jgi:hypothetical protein